jgi:hypothetical protein
MMHNKKGAIGLSINTLVIIIISLVILSGGITLLYKFIGGAEDIKHKLDQRTDQELERLLVNQGNQVALPLHTRTIERDDSVVFGIGIRNIFEKQGFTITADLDDVINEDGISIRDQVDRTELLKFRTDEIEIEEGEHQKEVILVEVRPENPTGEYIFTARVYEVLDDGLRPYGNPQKFIVTVK